MNDNYWTETQHKFLKKCCNLNLRQLNITVPDGGSGIYYFHEVEFENILNSGLYIIGKMKSGHTQTHSVPDKFEGDSHHNIPIWVMNLMHQVFENYKVAKKTKQWEGM